MPRDTYFSLDFEKGRPKSPKECKKKKPDGTIVDAEEFNPMQEFFDLLDNGDLTAIGSIYRGWVSTTTGEFLTGIPDPEFAQQCVVVYVGGTAYKICR